MFKVENLLKKVNQFLKLEYFRLVLLYKQLSQFIQYKYIQSLEYCTQWLMMFSFSMMQCLLKLKNNDLENTEKFATYFAILTTKMLHDIIVLKEKNPKEALEELEYTQLSNMLGRTKGPAWNAPWISESMRDITTHPIVALRIERENKEVKLQPTIEDIIELTENDFLEVTDK